MTLISSVKQFKYLRNKISDVSHGVKTKVFLSETLACIDIGTET